VSIGKINQMFYQPESFYATTLASAITAAASTISVIVAPSITEGYMVIEANTSNKEIIKYTGVSGTTLTGCVRGLATYGSDDSAGTGKTHAAGVEIANKDVHYYYAQYYDFLTGVSATGANNMFIGDGAAVSSISTGRFWYAITSSVSAFWGLSANGQLVISEDGTTSWTISAGGSGVTAGDGIDITAGDVSIDHLSASGLRISANQLAVNVGEGVSTTSAAELYVDLTHDYAWTGTHAYTTGPVSARTLGSVSATVEKLTVEDTNVSALYGGTTSDADDLHTHTFPSGLGSNADSTTYSYQVGWSAGTGDTRWTYTDCTQTPVYAGWTELTGSDTTWQAYTSLAGVATDAIAQYDDAKDITIQFRFKLIGGDGDFTMGLQNSSFTNAYDSAAGAGMCITIDFSDSNKLYAWNSATVAATTTDISAGITVTDWNLYKMVYTYGTDIKYYINGTLVATHTTNLPNNAAQILIGAGGQANGGSIAISDFIVTQEL